MWVYEKRLQYPVNITQTNAKLAQVIISQFGGPDGELAASQRYLSQRYTMPDGMTKGLLNDIGTEELAHIEIVCAIIYQLTKNLSVKKLRLLVLINIMLIIRSASGLRLLAVSHLMPAFFRSRVIPSLI